MNLDALITRFSREWQVIADSSSTFLFALILVSLGIWLALSWRYRGMIENRDSTIEHLKAKLPPENHERVTSEDPLPLSAPASLIIENLTLAAGLTPQTTTPVLLIADAKKTSDRLRISLEYSKYATAIGWIGWQKPRQILVADLKGVIRGQQIRAPIVSCSQGVAQIWWGGPDTAAGNLIQKSKKYRATLRFVADNGVEQTFRFFLLRTTLTEPPFIVEVFSEQDLPPLAF